MKISEAQSQEFFDNGLLFLGSCVSRSATSFVRESILDELTRLGLRSKGKWQTKKMEGSSLFQISTKLGQKLKATKGWEAIIPQELIELVQTLAGQKLFPTAPQVLFTPPQRSDWSLPPHGWHVDVARPSDSRIPGIQAFVLLDDVLPKGGGTLTLPGSHISRDIKPSLETIRELKGKAGDVYLIDMRIRHAPSPNASQQARIMLTLRYLPQG